MTRITCLRELPYPFVSRLYYFIREHLSMIQHRGLAIERHMYAYSHASVDLCACFIGILEALDILDVEDLDEELH